MPEERQNGNDFEVSVDLEYDFFEAAETDDVAMTLNYAELTDVIKEEMSVPVNLIECVALKIKNRIMREWPKVKSGRLTITKVHPPIPAPTPHASVNIEW